MYANCHNSGRIPWSCLVENLKYIEEKDRLSKFVINEGSVKYFSADLLLSVSVLDVFENLSFIEL